MSFSVRTRNVSGAVHVIEASGKLTIGPPVQALRHALRGRLDEGANKFVLDLGSVSYIDSSGLGELVASFSLMRTQGGDLKLLRLTAKTRDLLQITKLLTVFEVFEDEGAAVAAFGADSKRVFPSISPKTEEKGS
ncbi:MAG TPA: STAS domain-containing protein [Terriglobia bacterium]|nr:STAS domain-containing protein [Terriglobia bacterium]